MSYQNYATMRDELFRLRQAGDYDAAYQRITEASPSFPEHAGQLLFWRACLASRLGAADMALHLLQKAVDSGHWYSDQHMNDDDLRPLRGLPAFKRIADVCRWRQTDAQAHAVATLTPMPPVPPDRFPLLIGLHGGGGTGEATQPFWQPARRQGWLVAVPQSSQVTGPDRFGWDDEQLAVQEVAEHARMLVVRHRADRERTVIGGMAQGGGLAAWLALSGAVAARGFIAVAPFIPAIDQVQAFMARHKRPVRGYIVVGQDDARCLPLAEQLHRMMRANGFPCDLETHPHVGHDFPPLWERSLARALWFMTQEL